MPRERSAAAEYLLAATCKVAVTCRGHFILLSVLIAILMPMLSIMAMAAALSFGQIKIPSLTALSPLGADLMAEMAALWKPPGKLTSAWVWELPSMLRPETVKAETGC